MANDLLLTFAHDLRQPLRAIMMQAQRMQRTPGNEEETAARLAEIVAAAKRQEALIAAMVEFEQAGQSDGEGAPIPFRAAIQGACLKVDAYRKEQGGEIRGPEPAGPAPPGLVTPVLLQVLEKVLHNALKFHAAGVSPVVTIETVTMDGGDLAVRIRDRGLGIPAPYRETVFEPFRKLHPAHLYPGAGLSLATCRKLLAAAGGRVDLEEPAADEPGVSVLVRVPVTEVPER